MFNTTPVRVPNRNMFDLSHEVKMSGRFTYLYPVFIQETLPGDTFRNTSTIMLRLAPMLRPIMHRLNVTTHFFFVPYRLLTDHWEDFITGGREGDLAPILPYVTPNSIYLTAGGNQSMRVSTLWDYLGLPVCDPGTPASSGIKISALPFRAYSKIWNDFYKDPNFDDDRDLDLEVQGNVSVQCYTKGLLDLKTRGWRKDYFTSALPDPQRGPQVLMPVEGSGSVDYFDSSILKKGVNTAPAAGDLKADGLTQLMLDAGGASLRVENIADVNFTNTTVTINDFTTALATQRWLEANARGGYRYVDQLRMHFSTVVPDYRLQRAEYLGGGQQPVRISEVVSTYADTSTGFDQLGDLGGHGLSVGKTNRFTYRCVEHGIIMGIMSVMPDSAYQQGIEKLWSRESKFDFAWPEMAHLGEQAIISKELFYSFNSGDDDENEETFGYTPRYSEYKFKNDRVAGDFRDNLRDWHLGRIFTARPALDSTFTTAQEDAADEESMTRIFAAGGTADYLWIDIFHRCTAKRPLPYFGVPKLVG